MRPTWKAPTIVEPLEKLSGSTSVRWLVTADAAHVDCTNGSDEICSAAAPATAGTARTAATATPMPTALAARRRFTNPSMLSPLDTDGDEAPPPALREGARLLEPPCPCNPGDARRAHRIRAKSPVFASWLVRCSVANAEGEGREQFRGRQRRKRARSGRGRACRCFERKKPSRIPPGS